MEREKSFDEVHAWFDSAKRAKCWRNFLTILNWKDIRREMGVCFRAEHYLIPRRLLRMSTFPTQCSRLWVKAKERIISSVSNASVLPNLVKNAFWDFRRNEETLGLPDGVMNPSTFFAMNRIRTLTAYSNYHWRTHQRNHGRIPDNYRRYHTRHEFGTDYWWIYYVPKPRK
jgi:hypothetical protein